MKLFALCTAVALCATSCAINHADRGAAKGRKDARADLRRGKYVFERCGEPAPWHDAWAQLLRDNHGIEVRWVSGTAPDDETREHVRAYNEIMEPEISRRFGSEVLEQTFAEAKRIGPQSH